MPDHRRWSVCALGAAAMFHGAPAVAGGGPVAFNPIPLRSVMNDDVRVVWMGDSFSVPYDGRVSGAMLMTWPIRDWTSFSLGSGTSWFFTRFEELDPGVVTIDANNTYDLFDSGPEAGAGDQYALPLWKMREWHGGPGHGETTLLRMSYREVLRNSAVDDFSELNEVVRVRPLLLDAPGNRPSAGIRLFTDSASAFSPPIGAAEGDAMDGHIGVGTGALDIVSTIGGGWAFWLSAVGEGYAHMPGYRMERLGADGNRAPGLDWHALADGSWSYEDFGRGLPAGPGAPTKTFSREQLARWLGATSVDDEMPVFFFYYLAVEETPLAEFEPQLRAMIEQTEAAAADAGIGPAHHCFVIPHFHIVSTPQGDQLQPERFTEKRDAAFAYAATRDDMSVLSIYDYSDGVLFDGSDEARTWLLDRGYDNLVFGNRVVDLVNGPDQGVLLDARELHPAGKGAVAFSWMLAQMIIDACPADFAAPYGVLDLYDVSAFIVEAIGGTYRSDIADPRGVFDLNDLSRFVDSFVAGCGG